MNDDIEFIYEQYGRPRSLIPVGEPAIEAVPFPVSENYAYLLREHGRANFASGRLQLVAPGDLREIVPLVIGSDRELGVGACFAFAYTAFGGLKLWHETQGLIEADLVTGRVFCVQLTDPDDGPVEAPTAAMDVPIYMPSEDHDLPDEDGEALFARALRKLGEIDHLECYGFVPALALGGEAWLERLERRAAPEHFAILCQATEFTLVKVTEAIAIEPVRPLGS